MRNFLLRTYRKSAKIFPLTFYLIQYRRASKKLGNSADERNKLFNDLIESLHEKKCLQIGVKDNVGAKYGPNWISVDKYDTRDFIDYHYDIHNLEFDEESFDAIVCISILEHIPYPEKALKELHRVLRTGGRIWVQLPFQYPYHEGPRDYWRVSPDGLRIWMKDFRELSCGSYLWTRTALVTSTYFYGEK